MVGRTGIPRVRFVTSHPVNFDDEIIEAIADTPAVCRFIHLPVQSGSNRILKRMAREYTREFYLDRVRKLREVLPDLTISNRHHRRLSGRNRRRLRADLVALPRSPLRRGLYVHLLGARRHARRDSLRGRAARGEDRKAGPPG